MASRAKTLWWILGALAVGAALAAVVLLRGAGDGNAYRTAPVDRGPIRVAIAATGNLKAVTTVDVGSQLSGQIKTVEGNFNQRVKKGDPIARIDPANFQARVTQAEADLSSAQAQLMSAKAARVEAEANATNAERDLARKTEIRAKGLIAQADLDAAQLARDQMNARRGSSDAAIAVAQAQIRQKQAALANAKLDLEHTVISAPVDGVIVSRNVQPGQTVAASFQTPVLFQIAEDLAEMELDLAIDEADIGQVRTAQGASFTVDAFPGRSFHGAVKEIRLAATTTQNVVTYPVVVLVANPDFALMPGMTANAEIEVGGNPDALRVPNAALRFRPPEGTAATTPTPGRSGGARGFGDSSELKKKLQLTPDQEKTFDDAMAQMRARFQQRRAESQPNTPADTAPPSQPERRGGGAGRGDALRAALAPLRETLTDAQRATLDAELSAMGNAKRATLWKLERGKLVAANVRVGVADAEHTEVLGDALKPGDLVVVGQQRSEP